MFSNKIYGYLLHKVGLGVRMGKLSSSKDHLDIYNIIYRLYQIIHLKTILLVLNVESHLRLAGQDQTK